MNAPSWPSWYVDCFLGIVPGPKFKMFAAALMLVAIAAGIVFLWPRGDVSAYSRLNEQALTVYFYQNPLELENGNPRGNDGIVPQPLHFAVRPAALLLAFPMVLLAGVAIGLALRNKKSAGQPQRPKIQYVVITPPARREPVMAVSKGWHCDTKRDTSDFISPARRRCHRRFRSPLISSKRAGQLR